MLCLKNRTWYDDHENSCSTAWFFSCQLVWERYRTIRKNYEITKPNRFIRDNLCLSLMERVLDWGWGWGYSDNFSFEPHGACTGCWR